MRWRIATLGTVGTLLTLASAAFVFAPDLLLGIGPVEEAIGVLSGAEPTTVMLVGSVVVGLYVAVVARSTGSEARLDPVSDAERRFERAATNPPEAVTADRRQLTAATLDADVEAAIENGGDPLGTVRAVLAETAASLYAEQMQTDPETARAAIEAGTWTNDGVAAAFLAGENGPEPGLFARIRLWLTPERERDRRITRTVAAIHTVGEANE
ncbi:MAG: hypothetical protein ACI8XM_000407 [Haloarculaceae archaeon]|jgi:hypothetical protein